MRRTAFILSAVGALAVVTGVLHFADVDPVVVFVVAAAALGGLAWAISIATESVGERFGPAVTGALQSTLGNLPELFIVLFALSAGELVVARTSILGSLFANGLLVLGLAIVAGSRAAPDGMMRFRPRLPQDTATLLLLAIGIIVLLGLSHQVGDRASGHETAISVVGAIVLLAVYGLWAGTICRSDEPREEAHDEPRARRCRSGRRSSCSRSRGVAAALVSDWFIDALDPAVEALGISKAFTGLVIVAIAGNAVENVVGVSLAAKGKSDLAVSVVKNSVAQIAAFLFPALVLLSLAFDDAPDIRAQPGLHRRARRDRPRHVADHGRRRGAPVRGRGAGRAVRDPRDAHVVRVAAGQRPTRSRCATFGPLMSSCPRASRTRRRRQPCSAVRGGGTSAPSSRSGPPWIMYFRAALRDDLVHAAVRSSTLPGRAARCSAGVDAAEHLLSPGGGSSAAPARRTRERRGARREQRKRLDARLGRARSLP